MTVHQPVGLGTSIVLSASASVQSAALEQQSTALRVVADGANAFVGIGTFGVGYSTSYFVRNGDTAVLSLGKVTSSRITGISTTGTTTVIKFPEGQGSDFYAGQNCTLTANDEWWNFTNKTITSVTYPDPRSSDMRASTKMSITPLLGFNSCNAFSMA